ncbi:hypothetical protein ZWY2020_026542 [Hordeum vulgare]|nr:hypothetical protein ZWY2020_026542 [Hordeum vulgare]
MALGWQLCVLLLLLLAVASPVAALPTSNCYETVKGVPQRCSGEFITALFASRRRWISRECCQQLLFVREQSCFNAIRTTACRSSPGSRTVFERAAAEVPLALVGISAGRRRPTRRLPGTGTNG